MTTYGNITFERVQNIADNYIMDGYDCSPDRTIGYCLDFILGDFRVTDVNFFVTEELLEQLVDEYFNL